ncbi:chemotaxis protein [Blautia sp.]
MPTGNPKPQTVASKKYQDKVGWISKSYKLKKEVVELYADACEKAGVSQSGQLMKMMKEFADKTNREHSE